MTIILVCYFIIALIIFSVLDYLYIWKEKNPLRIDTKEEIVFISLLWIGVLAFGIFILPLYLIDWVIRKRKSLRDLNK